VFCFLSQLRSQGEGVWRLLWVGMSALVLSCSAAGSPSRATSGFVQNESGQYEASSRSQSFRAVVEKSGTVRLLAGVDQLAVRLIASGVGDRRHSVARPKMLLQGAQIGIERDGFRENYEMRASGLHHEVVVRGVPESASGRLWFRYAVSPGIKVLAREGLGLEARTGTRVWTYDGLRVWDATKRPLAAEITVNGSTFTISVDAKGARFPITVDPDWKLLQRVQPSDGVTEDRFGTAVALFGDTAVIGANVKNVRQGTAYVYARKDGQWQQTQKLTASDAASEDYFGSSVAIDGDYLAIGAYLKQKTKGAVYIFKRLDGVWVEQQILTIDSAYTYDYFGFCVSLSGDTLVVSADGQAKNRGAAYVFVRTNDKWAQTQRLTASDGATGDSFGWSLSLDGNNLLIGAQAKNTSQGEAYLFVREQGVFTEREHFLPRNPGKNQYFGLSVAIRGDFAAIGALGSNGNAGVVNVFTRIGGVWSQQELSANLPESSLYVGTSVFLQGDTIMASGSQKSNGAGMVVVFGLDAGAWSERLRLTRSDGTLDDKFGFSMSLDGGFALLGCTSFDERIGAAYFYDVNRNPIDVQLDRTLVTGGETVLGTVSVKNPAPAGGQVIHLASNRAELHVPTEITIPEGQVSATFQGKTDLLSASVTGFVTASAWGETDGRAQVQIDPGKITLTFESPTILAGRTGKATVRVSPSWLASGAKLTLSSDQVGVSVPTRLTIPVGRGNANFTVSTSPSATEYSASITVRGAGMSAGVGVIKVRLRSLSVGVSPGAIVGGQACQGTLTLSDPAPTGGVVVSLASSDGRVEVPTSVLIPEGNTAANFDIRSSPTPSNFVSTISATGSGVVGNSAVVSVSSPEVSAISVSSATVTGGRTVSATIQLNGVAPAGGVSVALSSQDRDVIYPSVNSILIPAGQNSVKVDFPTKMQGSVKSVGISASSTNATASIQVSVQPPTIIVRVNPESVIGGSDTVATVTVKLDVAVPSSGFTFNVACSSPAVSVPKTVTFAARASSVTFQVTHFEVGASTSATITCSSTVGRGTATLQVLPNTLTAITVSPTQVQGGSATQVIATLTLTKPAGSNGLVVNLASGGSAVNVPTSCRIDAGKNSGTFVVTHRSVSVNKTVQISASLNGRTVSTELKITP
jgi:FG-GAP repeat